MKFKKNRHCYTIREIDRSNIIIYLSKLHNGSSLLLYKYIPGYDSIFDNTLENAVKSTEVYSSKVGSAIAASSVSYLVAPQNCGVIFTEFRNDRAVNKYGALLPRTPLLASDKRKERLGGEQTYSLYFITASFSM